MFTFYTLTTSVKKRICNSEIVKISLKRYEKRERIFGGCCWRFSGAYGKRLQAASDPFVAGGQTSRRHAVDFSPVSFSTQLNPFYRNRFTRLDVASKFNINAALRFIPLIRCRGYDRDANRGTSLMH